MVQVPTATMVTVVPLTRQTFVVCELKLTVKPEVAVALTVNGAVPNVLGPSAANVIVCGYCAVPERPVMSAGELNVVAAETDPPVIAPKAGATGAKATFSVQAAPGASPPHALLVKLALAANPPEPSAWFPML